ncbi:hypothetical protein [uncultured Methanobrevibacter sp.]|uniref:hypothetical protein n=1 Tax=uncultured Methanobrevibacter sp. TaxID=253161 RepID=UPI0026015A4E|nr:hypothetical protein [uncultured Methanobrevibacter sp.]
MNRQVDNRFFIDFIQTYIKHKKRAWAFRNSNPEKIQIVHSEYKQTTITSRLNNRKNRIQVPTIGKIKFKTSKEHKQKIQESKINNMTIKYENGIYYGIININTQTYSNEAPF